MNKKGSFMKFASVLVLMFFVSNFVISCGGDDSSGDPAPYTYSDPNQAASASSEAGGMAMLLNMSSQSTTNMASEASGEAGYAAPKQGSARFKAIGTVDPELKTAADKMFGTLQSASVKRATAKARMAKAMQKTVNFSSACDNVGTGSVTVTGTDNSDLSTAATYTEATVTLTFTQCRDNISFTETNGTIQLYWKQSADGSAIANMTVTNFTSERYGTDFIGTPIETGSMNGTFNVTDNVNSGTASMNGSFNYSDASGSMTLTLSNLNSTWTHEDASGVITNTATLNGSYSLSITYGADSASITITARNMQLKEKVNLDKTIYMWLNGSIVLAFSPANCASGTITFTTADNTPITLSDEFDECPNSGTIQINNATIVYGSPIKVTVNGLTWTYTDCTAMDAAGNGICM